jgi:glycosyltransferase involved in cell wall biosynthesis
VIDLNEFDKNGSTTKMDYDTDRMIVITVGSLIDTKRYDVFLEALALARKKYDCFQGIIVGDGPNKAALIQKANNLGLLPNYVKFLGQRCDVPRLLKHADIFALTSEHEGFPNALIEAMAAGLPVVSTPAGDAEIIIRNNMNGYIAKNSTPQEIADLFILIASSSDARRQVGVAARQRVEKKYDYLTYPASILSIYRNIASYTRRVNVAELLSGIDSRPILNS